MTSVSSFTQSFDIGHTSTTFYDSSRSRSIETEIYYPAANAGEDVPVSAGSFPVLVFGHGFLMGWDSYENFWTELVPNGYVICFPTTEMGLTPSHEDFGLDLRFLAAQMQLETLDNGSLFFNSLEPKTGLMGHSMGGGASFLAAENNSSVQALINFAAAETTPSSVAASVNISIPALIFSGDDDCVAPPADHQTLMYNGLASDCKTHISIINGGHCYFAEDNFSCNFGEQFCNPDLDITIEEQQSVTFNFLTLWLDFSLKDSQNDLMTFNDSLVVSDRINYLQACDDVSVRDFNGKIELELFPNPVLDKLNLVLLIEHTGGFLHIYNIVGQHVYQKAISTSNTQIDLSIFPNGTYITTYIKDSQRYYDQFIKISQ